MESLAQSIAERVLDLVIEALDKCVGRRPSLAGDAARRQECDRSSEAAKP